MEWLDMVFLDKVFWTSIYTMALLFVLVVFTHGISDFFTGCLVILFFISLIVWFLTLVGGLWIS